MTEINIAHLRALIEKATPAPWGHFVLRGEFESTKEAVICAIAPLHDMRKDAEAAIKLADADADLMIAAVNNIAALCDEVERLRGDRDNKAIIDILSKRLDELGDALRKIIDAPHWTSGVKYCKQIAREALGKDE